MTTTVAARRRCEERTDPRTGEPYLAVFSRGSALKDDPVLNKGTCFTLAERDALGLRGLLPPAVSTPAEQEARAYENYLKAPDDVGRYVFLAALQDRNETLFHRLLAHHLDEMAPIVYTPTVGQVCESYSHIYRRPRGVYVSARDRGHIVDVLENAQRDDIAIIVVTDNSAILGIGDQGVGGMGIAIGKLALYTAGAGIHPARGLPLSLDVGTDNAALLDDPLYLGNRHARLRGDEYFSLVDELVEAIARVFPDAIVQWEDFASERAFRVLDRYRRRLPSFDDDIQGTGAIVEAGIRSALQRVGRRLADERVVFYGAGASGAGCALQLRRAMRDAGVPDAEIGRRVLCLDSKGLILDGRPELPEYKRAIAVDRDVAATWRPRSGDRLGLEDVVREFAPTILVGASGQSGAFTETIVKAMWHACPRPIVLPLSNPTSRAEATPADILCWTDGQAVVGTGSPFPPVTFGGVTHRIGQGNNVFVFPGIGLGATIVGASWLPDEAFSAAASAVHEFTEAHGTPDAPIYPAMSNLREVSRAVAVRVGAALVEQGAAQPMAIEEIDARVAAAMWEPVYRIYRPA